MKRSDLENLGCFLPLAGCVLVFIYAIGFNIELACSMAAATPCYVICLFLFVIFFTSPHEMSQLERMRPILEKSWLDTWLDNRPALSTCLFLAQVAILIGGYVWLTYMFYDDFTQGISVKH